MLNVRNPADGGGKGFILMGFLCFFLVVENLQRLHQTGPRPAHGVWFQAFGGRGDGVYFYDATGDVS